MEHPMSKVFAKMDDVKLYDLDSYYNAKWYERTLSTRDSRLWSLVRAELRARLEEYAE